MRSILVDEACHFVPERAQIRFLRWAASGGLSIIELHEIDPRDFSAYRLPNGKAMVPVM